jgi:hypothetical protein
MLDTIKTVSRIVLFLIYIPAVIVILVKCKGWISKVVLLVLTILSLPVMYVVIFETIPYYELTGFEGRVIDADTKEPIEGASVLAVYYDQWTSIAGTNTYPIDAQETLTDAKGDFKIPELKKWFGGRPGTVSESKLMIFKPGYGLFPAYMSRGAKESRSIESQGKLTVYELPTLTSVEERWGNLPSKWDFPQGKSRRFAQVIDEEQLNLREARFKKTPEAPPSSIHGGGVIDPKTIPRPPPRSRDDPEYSPRSREILDK